jgi:UDP-2,4-diacetamido-2,4,6-trideoxy-beta-L-altropyranose hydrolase
VHAPQPALADLMSACSVAASAGGVTLWERLCVGLPGVVVSLADNQVPSCRALADAGLIDYLGRHRGRE